jgi:hypothetical protein
VEGAGTVDDIEVIDPSGTEPSTARVRVMARPSALAGRRIAVLDNGKPNADYVVRQLGRHLHQRFGAQEPVAAGKAIVSRPCPDEVLAGFRGFDAAVVGVGD